MKLRVGLSIATLAVAMTSALWAQGQVATGAAGVNAPASAISFNPYITTGAHSTQEVSGTSGEYTAGPYIAPGFESLYKTPSLTIAVSYEAEIGASRGFGDTSDKTISGNTYMVHHPVLAINGGSSKWKFNGVVDASFTVNNSASKLSENNSDIAFVPGVQYWVDPTLAITTDVVVQRTSFFDTATLDSDNLSSIKSKASVDAKSAKAAESVEGARAALSPTTVGQAPTAALYAGALGIKKTINESLKLTTYIRAGHKVANYTSGEAYAYRFHAHLDFTTPIAELSGLIRYRMNVNDVKGGEINYQNYNLVQLTYDLNKNWAIMAQNELAATKDTTGAGKAMKYQNENYIGATYKF